MRLSELKTGEKGVIVKVLGHGGFRKRIVEMGFIKGKTVEVLLNAPLKDPIKYKVMGYEISLRRQEAEMIEIVGEKEMCRESVQLDYHEGWSEDMRLDEEELKRIALGKRAPSMSLWWVIPIAARHPFSTSPRVRTSMWVITAVSP